jgi:uncharacterized protein
VKEFLYLDSSAAVKYYIQETGSRWIHELLGNPVRSVVLSQLAAVEVAAAIERRTRAGTISQRQRVRALAGFAADYRHRFALVHVHDALVQEAVKLVARRPLRAYDALQLASALWYERAMNERALGRVHFISADAILCAAARAEGLAATNPNDLTQEE